GKLAARLVPVLALVGCALPLMAILTLLGGVAPDALASAFIVTIGIGVLGCSLALGFSLRAKRTHEAMLATYSVWGIWVLWRPFITLMNSAFGWSLAYPPKLADPYLLAFAPYWYPGTTTLADYLEFLATTVGISLAVTGWVVFRVRAVCTTVEVAKKASVRRWLERFAGRLDPSR